MQRVPYPDLLDTLATALRKLGFEDDRAHLCASLFAETTRDGVYSHGLNRFPRFVRMIRNGSIDIHARPQVVAGHGVLERWDGKGGPGNLNAHLSMERAIALSRLYGAGVVTLANTNHWMRGGTYGWQAAASGCIGICWTNTLPNLPPWGAADPRLGNNPLVIAVPRGDQPVVLDMAMSQFSYGSVESHQRRNVQLRVPGGYNSGGELTTDPSEILESRRLLPAGYWKGSGLAVLLDLLAALLSGGSSTVGISRQKAEYAVSQVFIAIDLSHLDNSQAIAGTVNEVIQDIRSSVPTSGTHEVLYPGQRVLLVRKQNLEQGIPIDRSIWEEVKRL
jgi:3-dehydro-L-gulonate 2-dehydrogenase